MKCARCGAELKLGCIYCSVCGQEAQIVSDTNLLEDELLRELLQEENTSPKNQTVKKAAQEKKKALQKKRQKWLVFVLSALTVVIAVSVTLVITIQNKNRNSFVYQVAKAESYREEKEYGKALEFYGNALELKEDDIPVRFSLVELYLVLGEKEPAIAMLQEILSMEDNNVKACQQLIGLYAQEKDYEAILELKELVNQEDERILGLFSEYEPKAPEFSREPGTYSEYITIGLSGEKGSKIYYTLDGSDPTQDGELYERPFSIEEQGTLTIQAVACNSYGIYSGLVEGSFSVEFKDAPLPKATPDGGTFLEPTTIGLSGPEGSRMYYTWDGSTPTMASTEYTGPIPVPEGNNILSVILVDQYGMVSDVLKCNYRYMP